MLGRAPQTTPAACQEDRQVRERAIGLATICWDLVPDGRLTSFALAYLTSRSTAVVI